MDGADGVYPASEDTHLLIDALHKELPFIKENVPDHPLCIEIGYVILFALFSNFVHGSLELIF